MPASRKILEDSIRLSRIQNIKLTLYAVQAAMLIALAFLLIYVLGGAKLKPTLYLPLTSFIAVVVLLMLILCLESFFFRILEVRFARSSSARHLMAKNSIKRAFLIAVVTGILALVLTVPSIRAVIEDNGQSTVDVSPNTTAPSFYSSDPFGLINVVRIHVTAPKAVQVYLVDDQTYNRYSNLTDYFSYRLNTRNFTLSPNIPQTIKIPESGFVKYRLVLDDQVTGNLGTSATMKLDRAMSGTFTGIVSMLLIAFVVTNIAWIAYLMPIERKYSVGSIYK